jgi:hypothetical protein
MIPRLALVLPMLAWVVLVATPLQLSDGRAQAGTIPYGDYTSSDMVHFNVVRELNDYANPLLTPPNPVFTELVDGGRLVFEPDAYIQTSQSTLFELQTKTTTLNMLVVGQAGGANSGLAGYFIDNLAFSAGGNYSVWAPFSNSFYTSEAQVEMAASVSLRLSGLNWSSVSGSTISRQLTITPSSPIHQAGPSNLDSGSWSGNLYLSEAELRSAFGITNPNDYITEVSVSYNSRIAAASSYGMGEARLTGLEVSAGMEPVAVPEPPTIILAGLGAVAVVANGYRRKKQRRGSSLLLEHMEDTGAIALTA